MVTIEELEARLEAGGKSREGFLKLFDDATGSWFRELKDAAQAEAVVARLLALAEQYGDDYHRACLLRQAGTVAAQKFDYPRAIRCAEEAAQLFRKNNQLAEVITCNNQVGKVYANLGDYSRAIDLLDESLSLSVTIGDHTGEANTLNALSVIYQRAGNAVKAGELAQKGLDIALAEGLERLQAIARINIGNAYALQEEWDNAIAEWTKSNEIFEKVGDAQYVASALGNIGIAYQHLGKLEEAKANIERCLAVKQELNDVYDVARSLHNLGTVYLKMGNPEEAKRLFDRALAMGDPSQAKPVHVLIYQDMVDILKQMGDHKGALEVFEKFYGLQQSLFNEDINMKTQALQIRFEVEKMETENEIYRLRNIDLAAANEEITRQKEVIEQKNKDITDSIIYAKRIQEAVLPTPERLGNWFGEFFVLYLPKDIVSGDFYWAAEKDGKFLLAVADATGHGVPGAIMSMMGSSFLSEIVGEQGVTEPAPALAMLRRKVINAMQQADSETGDGMDIVLCAFDPAKKQLSAACANNPLWLIRDNSIIEIAPDKFPVGIFPGDPKRFTAHTVSLQTGDVIYMFTDGYADQFGGPKGKKFGYRQLRELLLRIHQLPMQEQKLGLEKTFVEWKGEDEEQVDDVLVVGIRI